LIKDESVNPTGTHKDQLALELAQSFMRGNRLAYKTIHERGHKILLVDGSETALPEIQRLSLLTSGHGGIALAKRFKTHGLPPPKLLLDTHTDPEIIDQLKNQAADIYLVDMNQSQLKREDILQLTNNREGSDLTSDNITKFGVWQLYYRTLSKQILDKNPSQIYVPYGSGNLFEGLVQSASKKKVKPKIFGSEPESPNTKAVMLYAPSKPFKRFGQIKETPNYAKVDKVTETEIESAHDIYKNHNIKAGYSSSAGLALYLRNFKEGKISDKDTVIVVNTGRGIVKKDW
jgi:cysteine synthase